VAKVTSKLQVTIPKALAAELGIEPGDEIQWSASGGAVRLTKAKSRALDIRGRLALFDQATLRQRARERKRKASRTGTSRGWTRDELYERGRSR
jgi:AbrB family looped-hinge helix DNA binding protein